MPELPDVEVRKRTIESTSLDKRIDRVSVRDGRILKSTTPTSLARGLKGARLLDVRRRGKYLLISTDRDGTLLMHFGMTGDVEYQHRGEPEPPWSRVALMFEDGSRLHYTNKRLLGRIALYQTTEEADIPDTAGLGPEPLAREMSFKRFKELMEGRSLTVHQALMDQKLIAGIGNIFSDEITYQAGIRPDRRVSDLSEEEMRLLFEKMKWVLKRAIQLDAEMEKRADLFIIPHREKGGKCPRDGTALVRKTIGGRSSYYCPGCQR